MPIESKIPAIQKRIAVNPACKHSDRRRNTKEWQAITPATEGMNGPHDEVEASSAADAHLTGILIWAWRSHGIHKPARSILNSAHRGR